MQLVQKKALLALLSMIESAVRELRSVISADGEPEVPERAAHPFPSTPSQSGILSDNEELTLEKMMEDQRQALLRGATGVAERFYQQDAPLPYPKTDFFVEDITP